MMFCPTRIRQGRPPPCSAKLTPRQGWWSLATITPFGGCTLVRAGGGAGRNHVPGGHARPSHAPVRSAITAPSRPPATTSPG